MTTEPIADAPLPIMGGWTHGDARQYLQRFGDVTCLASTPLVTAWYVSKTPFFHVRVYHTDELGWWACLGDEQSSFGHPYAPPPPASQDLTEVMRAVVEQWREAVAQSDPERS